MADYRASSVHASSTHAVLSGNAVERFQKSVIQELICTDTVPLSPEKLNGTVKVVSVAALFGEAIHRIHSGLSIGAMFDA